MNLTIIFIKRGCADGNPCYISSIAYLSLTNSMSGENNGCSGKYFMVYFRRRNLSGDPLGFNRSSVVHYHYRDPHRGRMFQNRGIFLFPIRTAACAGRNGGRKSCIRIRIHERDLVYFLRILACAVSHQRGSDGVSRDHHDSLRACQFQNRCGMFCSTGQTDRFFGRSDEPLQIFPADALQSSPAPTVLKRSVPLPVFPEKSVLIWFFSVKSPKKQHNLRKNGVSSLRKICNLKKIPLYYPC